MFLFHKLGGSRVAAAAALASNSVTYPNENRGTGHDSTGDATGDGGWPDESTLQFRDRAPAHLQVGFCTGGRAGACPVGKASRRCLSFVYRLTGRGFGGHSRLGVLAIPTVSGSAAPRTGFFRFAFLRCFVLLGLVAATALPFSAARADDWPQWRGPKRDGVWRESGIVETLTDAKLLWSAPISGGYSGPVVADGRVYVSDRIVRPTQMERVHCFDARTGKKVWDFWYDCPYVDVGYDAGPRATMLIDAGRAYSLGAMGDLYCFDAATGRVVFLRDFDKEFDVRMPNWGIAASPIVDGDLLICQIGGAGDACFVALDKKSGEERWRALTDEASYSSPVLIQQAGRRVLVGWTGDRVVGLDPQSGAEHWGVDFPHVKWIRNTASPVVEGERLFFSALFQGSLMLRAPRGSLTIEELWRRRGASEKQGETDALHTSISTSMAWGGLIYGVDSYGELRCLDAASGDRLWESLEATPSARWSNIFFVRNGDRWWLLNELGELILCRLDAKGFHEVDRLRLLAPTGRMLPKRRGGVVWSHPAFANRHVYARSDEELVCARLASP